MNLTAYFEDSCKNLLPSQESHQNNQINQIQKQPEDTPNKEDWTDEFVISKFDYDAERVFQAL